VSEYYVSLSVIHLHVIHVLITLFIDVLQLP